MAGAGYDGDATLKISVHAVFLVFTPPCWGTEARVQAVASAIRRAAADRL
jgi:hypothetical protein